MKKLLATFLIVVIAGVAFYPLITRGAWYNNDYAHRKSHNITGAYGAGTNYQVKIIAYKATGTDSAGVVYLGTGVQNDFDDVRFTDNDETTSLDFYIASTTSGVSAEFWVEVADTLTSNATIYVYYENASATSASNGSNTFLFFDDFSGDLSKWSIDSENTDSITISSGSLRHDPDASQTKNAYSDSRARTASYQVADGAIHYKSYLGGPTNRKIHQFGFRASGLTFTSGYAYRNQNSASDGGFFEFSGGSWTNIGGNEGPVSANTWYNMMLTASSSSFVAYRNGTQIQSTTDATTAGPNYLTTHVHGVSLSAGTDYVLIDDVFVRKFVGTEPAHSTWGSEENAPAGPVGETTQLARINNGGIRINNGKLIINQ